MPQYGAKMLQWAPFAATNPEPADSLPNYGTPMNLGALQSVAETLNFSEGEARGDDVRKIYIKEFVDGSLAVGVLELANATASAITGATVDSTQNAKDIHFSANDNAPYGCHRLHEGRRHKVLQGHLLSQGQGQHGRPHL